ncbi:MAG: TolC family protein [Parachlamydiales bacterium]|nr:TolC family protein [Parachlamydiales bacterium]
MNKEAFFQKSRQGTSLLFVVFFQLITSCTNVTTPFELAPICPDTSWLSPNLENTEVTSCNQPVYPNKEIPLGLCQLVDIGLENSVLTRQTWASARIAAAQYAEELSNYYPDVNLQGTLSRAKTPTFGGFSSGDAVETTLLTTYGPQLTLSYLLLDFGQTKAASEALRQTLLNANWTHNRQIQTVIQNIASDYFNYVFTQEQLQASEANLKDANTNLQAAEQKHIMGISDISDELSAKTQRAQILLTVLNDRQEMQDALAQLLNDLGVPSDIPVKLESLPEDPPIENACKNIQQYLAEAYSLRPDLMAARSDLMSKKANLSAAKRATNPTLSFSGTGGRTFYAKGYHDDYDYDSVLTLSIPLFKGFYYRNQVKQAKATLELSRATLAQLELSVSYDVVTSYRNLLIAKEQIHAGKDYLVAAQKFYAAALSKYRAGTTDFTTLMAAQASLANARSAYVNAKSNWYIALKELAYSTGSLSPQSCKIQPCLE